MKKIVLTSLILINFLFIILVSSFLFLSAKTDLAFAQEDKCNNISSLGLEEIGKCLDELSKAKEQSEKATKPLEDQLNGIKNRVVFIEKDLIAKGESIKKGYDALGKRQEILNKSIRRLYIKNYQDSPLAIFLSLNSAFNITKALAYDRAQTNQDKSIITNIVLALGDLENKKKNLESEQKELVVVKEKLDKVVLDAKTYQASLSSKIAQLSAQQQQLIAQRLGSLNIPRSAAASALYCTDDRKIDPGFSPAFAFFTFGIPHYVGLNQYGAYGRAKANQDYKTILNAYFQNISIECRDLPSQIDVQGYGQMPFDDYIKGVVNKEMGADLPEALKAQAVAARSYAFNQPKPICTSQSCQVYSPDRRDAANSAVDATGANTCGSGKGEVVVSNGDIATTWFASTFGGFAHRSSPQLPNAGNTSYTKEFADTTGPVNSFADLFDKAYDRESACFYTAQGWRDQYHKSAWLKPSEVADIVNSLMLFKKNASAGDHLYQTDKPHPYGGENWNEDKVKQELRSNNITPYDSLTNISVGVDFGSGNTTSINVSGNAGSTTFSGSEFKDMFNLRAPANLHIPGRLYNVETK